MSPNLHPRLALKRKSLSFPSHQVQVFFSQAGYLVDNRCQSVQVQGRGVCTAVPQAVRKAQGSSLLTLRSLRRYSQDS